MNEENVDGARAKEKRLRSASNSSLPLVSIIPDTETMKQATVLLKEAGKLKCKISEAQERLDEIELELAAVASAYELKGFRYGLFGFDYRGYTSRKTLDKTKLVAELSARGIPASVIDSCYRPGEPYLDARITAFDME